MSKLRKSAKGKQCQVRLPGCGFDDDTVVLAHYRSASTGMGQKSLNLHGSYCCESCHARIDHRVSLPNGWEGRDVELAFLEGIIRTQSIMVRDGLIVLND